MVNALEVSAVKASYVEGLGKFAPVGYADTLAVYVVEFACFDIVILVAVAESVHIDLVKDGSFCPVGGVEAGGNFEIECGVALSRAAHFSKVYGLRAGFDQVTVAYKLSRHDEFCVIKREAAAYRCLLHGNLLFAEKKGHFHFICGRSPKSGHDFFARVRLGRKSEQSGFVGEQRSSVY